MIKLQVVDSLLSDLTINSPCVTHTFSLCVVGGISIKRLHSPKVLYHFCRNNLSFNSNTILHEHHAIEIGVDNSCHVRRGQ